MRRFVTIFPDGKNLHLVKDVGMIGFVLQKHFGYQSAFASYRNGDYPHLDSFVEGLRHITIRKYFQNQLLDVLLFLTFNFRKFDVIHVFHLRLRSCLWAIWFKLLTLNRGKVYLKLDCDERIYDFRPKGIKKLLSDLLFSKIDTISVETKAYQKYLNANRILNSNVHHIPNGYYDWDDSEPVDFNGKENLIITVGRIGTKQKATEILCEAFAQVEAELSVWKLEIIGPIEESFQPFIRRYFQDQPHLQSRVKFVGEITDRKSLLERYKRAKIFALTSRWEGFPIVLPEAIRQGCYVIASDLPAASDITSERRYGDLFPVDDYSTLALKLRALHNNPHKLSANCESVQAFARSEFSWITICGQLSQQLG